MNTQNLDASCHAAQHTRKHHGTDKHLLRINSHIIRMGRIQANGPKLLKNLEREGIPAALIGRTRTAIGREIYSGEVHSFLDRPKPDEIDKMKDLPKSH